MFDHDQIPMQKGTIVGVLETTNLTIMTEKEEEKILT